MEQWPHICGTLSGSNAISTSWGKNRGGLTIFQAPSSSRTFDYQASDVGYMLVVSRYIENTGDEDVSFLQVVQMPQFVFR